MPNTSAPSEARAQPSLPSWEWAGRLAVGILMLVGLGLPWVKSCVPPGFGVAPQATFTGFEIVGLAGEILFVDKDWDNPGLVGSMVLLPLVPLLLLVSLRLRFLTRGFLGTIASYFLLYLIYARYDLRKDGHDPLLGFWVFSAGVALALGILVAGGLWRSRQPRRSSVP